MSLPFLPRGAALDKWCRQLVRGLTLLLIMLMCDTGSIAYSVLTHEQIVDLVWTDQIRPLLLKRFPGLSEDEIREAHAYAYGGAVIQDLGYYPFGSTEFSDLVHYVRSGDFVFELLRQSQDVNEYAFALGALSHYASDVAGHPAVNQAVAIQYPKLQAKFGKSVRYAEDKTAHLKTEFGFDMAQVAKNRYASEQYHDFLGFKVSKALLERAFPVIYGVELNDVLTHEDLAIGSYRFSVSRLIPQMTQVALQTHKKDLMRETPSFAKQKFLYRLSRSDYEKEWGKDYVKPGLGTRILSTLLRYFPKIGPFKAMGFNNPTTQTEELYFKSINTTVDQYRVFLQQVRTDSLVLPNRDFDSGNPTKAAEYPPTDGTYAKLLSQLSDRKFNLTSMELRANILDFYSDLSLPIETKQHKDNWKNVLTSLNVLGSAAPNIVVGGPIQLLRSIALPPPAPVLVIGFVGGLIKHDNPVHSEVQLAARLRAAYPTGVEVETFENYRGERAYKKILAVLDVDGDGTLSPGEKQNARIIIYGHSWGGSETVSLARDLQKDGIAVLLTIQVDSVSKGRQNHSLIPSNVAQAANFYQLNGLLHGEPEIKAADPSRTTIIGNFRFDYKTSKYNCTKYPWYDRVLSKAHTQIECDPIVWGQAESLIRANLPPADLDGQAQ
jgi:hypothetical protein